MKLLILGGTIFLGRHLLEAALKQGHDVTLFNRGVHGADLYPDVEKLQDNRQSDLTTLQGRHWAWDRQRSEAVQWQAGLSAEDEARFLQAWHQQAQ